MPKTNKPGKVALITSREADIWFLTANRFANSLTKRSNAIHQFNSLSIESKSKIIKLLKEYEEIRKTAYPEDMSAEEKKHHVSLSIMVDAHILATEFGVDPVVILMCLNPPCKSGQKIVVK